MKGYFLRASLGLLLFGGTACATAPTQVPPTAILEMTPNSTKPAVMATVPGPTSTPIPVRSTPTVLPTALATAALATAIPGWTTYTDPQCNVQFQYPETWSADPTRTPDIIVPGNVQTVYVILSEPAPLAGGGGPHAGLKIQLFCDPLPDNAEPRAIVNDFIEVERNGGMDPVVTPVIPDLMKVSVNSHLAFTTIFDGAGLPTRVYYIFPPESQRNRVVRLSFSPDGLMPETVVTILRSWQFLE